LVAHKINLLNIYITAENIFLLTDLGVIYNAYEIIILKFT